ncbi:zinc-binding alcohol dehydrogenase [Micromonospora sp. M12]
MQVGRVVESATPAVAVGTVGAMTYGHRTGWLADPVAERSWRCPTTWTRCSASTWRTWARSAPTVCCTPPPTCTAPTSARSETGTRPTGRRGRRRCRGAVDGAVRPASRCRVGGGAGPTPHRRQVAEALGLETLDPDADDPAVVLKTRWRTPPVTGVPTWCSSAGAGLGAAARPAPAAAPGHSHRPRLLPGGRGRRPARRGVPPQRAVAAVRADRPGAARARPHLGPERLSAETVDLLRTYGDVIRKHLVSAVVLFDEAPTLLTDLADRRRQELQVVLAV